MSDYRFYTAILRFVAQKSDRNDPQVAAMMTILEQAAVEIESLGSFNVIADRLEMTARAFAGVAAFLQKQILPEVIAAENKTGETQVRWAIDNAMEAVNALLGHAALAEQRSDMRITLPAPPL